ncbi:hypothetical protein BH11MYX1_BH11MYX1_55950 [soil metagenome]
MARTYSIMSLIAVSSLALAGRARADNSTVVVVGKAEVRDQLVIAAAITSALKQAQWTLIEPPFSSAELAMIVVCLDSEKPWPCIEPTTRAKGLARMLVVEANPEKVGADTQIKVVGQLFIAGVDGSAIEQQYCKPCSNTALAQTAAEVTTRLLDSTGRKSETALDIHTIPIGAVVTLDGHMIGESDGRFAVGAGRHKLMLQVTGHRPVIRELDLAEGTATPITETFVRLDGSHDESGPSHLIPSVVIGAGVVAVAVGSYLSWTAEPGPREQRSNYYYSGPGLALAGAGVAAIGVGIYLWLQTPSPASSPVVSIGPSGSFAGWTGTF